MPASSASSLPASIRYRPIRQIDPDMLCATRPFKRERRYRITITQHCIAGIMLIFANRGISSHSTVTVELYAGSALLRAKTLTGDALTLDGWSYFTFDPLIGHEMQSLTLKIIPNNCAPVIYEYKKNRSFWYKVLNKLHIPSRKRDTIFFEVVDGKF